MKVYQRFLFRALGGALCLSLVGCSGETIEPGTGATPQPSVSATAVETGDSDNPDQPQANNSNPSSNDGTDPDSEDARVVTLPSDENLQNSNPITVMKIEPGTERLFQNPPNEAEVAYAKKQNEERQKARIAAKDARENNRNDGNDAPVMNPGGVGEMVEVK